MIASRSMSCAAGLADRLLLGDVVLHLPDPVAELRALAADDVDLAALLELVDVGRAQGAPRDVDLTGLDRGLQRSRVGEVLHEDRVGLRGPGTVVALVGLEDRLLARLVLAELVGAGADDGVVGHQRSRPGSVLVDDRGRRRRQQLEEGRVRRVQVEDHRQVVGSLDGAVGQGRGLLVTVADVVEEHRGTVGVRDLDVALEREEDVGGGELVAVGERQALAERAGDGLRVVVGARLGSVTHRLRRARGDREQLLEDVVLNVPRAEVVGTGRVHRGDGLRGAEFPGGAASAAVTGVAGAVAVLAVVIAAASGAEGEDQAAHTSQGQSPSCSKHGCTSVEGWNAAPGI